MTKKKDIQSYAHRDKQRTNNPPVGLVTPDTDKDAGKKTYAHDPHIDPELSWAGKTEHTSFQVPTVSLHVHERIDPRTIVEAVRRRNGDSSSQHSLFEDPKENPPIRQAIDFYRHRHDWTNRLIAGDSLLVMNSLLEKEGQGGKVQMVYMDPPYGIRYGSNFQPFVGNPDVGDTDADLAREPETIRAFRDTWELGIHSYLTYLRDRFLLVRELLHKSGSCFVQIGKENVHRVGMIADEVFGAGNRMATISYAATSGTSTKTLPETANYLLWYARDRQHVKYRQLYEPLTRPEVVEHFASYAMVELPDGTCRNLTVRERYNPSKYLPEGARLCKRVALDSQGVSKTGRSDPYEWKGREYRCAPNRQWSVSQEGMDRLAELNRLEAVRSLAWKRYEEEVPGKRINNIWHVQMSPNDKRYAVQTDVKTIMRCILMTTDPGDLVFDPTCGSGTTAHVAEQWGRRWTACDTSRVAVAIARQRLMTADFDYYALAHPDEGVGSGFHYRTVDTVTARTLAYDEPAQSIALYDQPEIDRGKARVTGPFTVEAVPAPGVKPLDEFEQTEESEPWEADESIARSGETIRQSDWRDELLKVGIRGKAGQRISFARLEPLAGARSLHAEGDTRPDDSGADSVREGTATTVQRVVVSFGPDHAPLEQRQVNLAIDEAQTLVPRPKIIVFAAFQFDPEAAKDIDETSWPGVQLLKAHMNADLLTDDLRRKSTANESFWLIGQPDVEVETVADGEHAGKHRVSVKGFDYYNTKTGQLESGGEDQIAVWMLDPDYDGRSLFPRQVFFPASTPGHDWTRLAKNLKAEIDPDLIAAYRGTVSLPFEAGKYGRAAVKIVDDRGIESLKIVELK